MLYIILNDWYSGIPSTIGTYLFVTELYGQKAKKDCV